QLGFVVRGIYGEGSEATGNVFQISNQITLGKSEADIVEDLRMIVIQLIEQERVARNNLLEKSRLKLTDRIYRSFGILKHSRDRKSTRLNSSHVSISYAVFCLKKNIDFVSIYNPISIDSVSIAVSYLLE